jgi:hypothetical protein
LPRVEREHLLHLQDKLNAYLRVIESGALKERLLESVGREVAINSVSKFPLSEKEAASLKKAETSISTDGFPAIMATKGSINDCDHVRN